MTDQSYKFPRIIFALFMGALLIIVLVFHEKAGITLGFAKSDALYLQDGMDFEQGAFKRIDWQVLLGDKDKALFATLKQQQNTLQNAVVSGMAPEEKMEADLLMSALKANTWNALDGYQVNPSYAEIRIEIPGFLVPLDMENQRVSSFFIVPYFGACLHFPPPQPNQIIYVQLPQSIELQPLDTPLLFSGKLVAELFEDPIGTSAWTMDVAKITPWQGETDDTRLHQ